MFGPITDVSTPFGLLVETGKKSGHSHIPDWFVEYKDCSALVQFTKSLFLYRIASPVSFILLPMITLHILSGPIQAVVGSLNEPG